MHVFCKVPLQAFHRNKCSLIGTVLHSAVTDSFIKVQQGEKIILINSSTQKAYTVPH